MVCSRSPCATASMVRVTSAVGQSRSSISVLTESSISPHAPPRAPSLTRWRVRPSRPTCLPTLSSCCAMRSLVATISLKASAILPQSKVQSFGRRTEKSPLRTPCSAVSSSWISPCASSFPFSMPLEITAVLRGGVIGGILLRRLHESLPGGEKVRSSGYSGIEVGQHGQKFVFSAALPECWPITTSCQNVAFVSTGCNRKTRPKGTQPGGFCSTHNQGNSA